MKTPLIKNESGIALVTALLVLMLATGLMAGLFAAVLANQRSHATDRDQSLAYAAAHAGLEKLTAGLAALFTTDFSPDHDDLSELDNHPPTIDGFVYDSPGGDAGSGYVISYTPDANGNPTPEPSSDITTGPFEGFKGLITPYVLTVTARSTSGNSEVRLRRELQTVAVPVFQFGIFGEKSLGFHAGPNFDFGGRVHTNENLYLASGNGSTLTFRDKITAVNQVVRNTLSNGVSIVLTNHEGTVSIPRVIGGAPATYRNLLSTESSGTTAAPWAGWKNLSEVTYRTNIRTEATGAKRLTLPLASNGAQPIDLIRRPAVDSNEDDTNAIVFGQRYFAQASLRILLSDRMSDLTGLPTITAGNPLQLDGAGPTGYAVDLANGRTPIATSPGAEPVATIGGVAGTSTYRVSAIDAANARLTIQSYVAGAWTTNVPQAFKQPAGQPLATITATGFVLPCTGIEPNLLSGCDTNVAPTATTRHPLIAANSQITITLGNGTTVIATTNGASAANSATIALNNFNPVMRYAGTGSWRSFYIGESPVICTGFRRQPASTDQPANMLSGCTLPGGVALDNGTSGLSVNDPIYIGGTTTAGTPLLNGYLKIEKQDSDKEWTDVTLEILNLGFADTNQEGDSCGNPSPNAVLRFQRLRDNAYTTNACGADAVGVPAQTDYWNSVNGNDYVPNMLYDAREGNTRLQNTGANDPGIYAGGLFGYVALDVNNLRRWFAGNIGTTGTVANNNNGYIVYFSDRRGDHNENAGDAETGEYGNEDSINPAAQAWAKTNQLETGEDFNENGTLETYGETPHALAVPGTVIANLGFEASQRPWSVTALKYTGRARLARPVLFRRALKIVNGGLNQLPVDGLTIVSENPVYVKGNFNAASTDVTAEPNRPAAIMGDSITLLSNNFLDTMTFEFPNTASSRPATTTGYRFAMVTGKAIPFPKPALWGVNELGSDGGVHNFMKMLENWGGQTLRYRGSMVSLYYSRQAIGIYRADANIYGAPTRGFNFDTDFLTPSLLPPGTPMFRDINTLKFRQILRPNQ